MFQSKIQVWLKNIKVNTNLKLWTNIISVLQGNKKHKNVEYSHFKLI